MLADMIKDYMDRFRAASSSGKYTETVAILDDMRTGSRTALPDSAEIATLLQKVLLNPDMPGANFCLMAAWYSLSPDYVPLLCEIVSSKAMAAWHEQAVELLGELSDPRAIPALAKALVYRWDYDEWLSVPRKALDALKAIGTEEALAVAQCGPDSGIPDVPREEP